MSDVRALSVDRFGDARPRASNRSTARVESYVAVLRRIVTWRAVSLALLPSLASTACAKDVILPVDAVCGDMKKTGNEECDVASDGCVECKIAPGWECGDTTCTPICGDGMKVGDEECDPPNGITCDSACKSGSKPEACDMTGYWIARQTDFSIDTVLSQVQTSTNWYVFKMSQTGNDFSVDLAINCGIKVTGSAAVDLSAGGVKGLLHLNPQDKDSPRGPRKGTFSSESNGCAFSFDRNYMVRGGDPSLLPADFTTKPDLSTLTPLPTSPDPENAAGTTIPLAVDVDGDGSPGVAWIISGNANGVRNTVQRDWNEYFTEDGSPVPANAIEMVVRVRFDNQENILAVSKCPLVGCGILLASSHPATNLKDRATLRYLGKDLTDPRVSSIVVAELKASVDGDLQTCTNMIAALPHDASKM